MMYAGNQRKPSSVHDTHVPFNTMRFYSPAELSRMKTDKDTKATQEVQLRRRQEEVARANLQARLTPVGVNSLFALVY
jgi:chromatin modification-related protein VID21